MIVFLNCDIIIILLKYSKMNWFIIVIMPMTLHIKVVAILFVFIKYS